MCALRRRGAGWEWNLRRCRSKRGLGWINFSNGFFGKTTRERLPLRELQRLKHVGARFALRYDFGELATRIEHIDGANLFVPPIARGLKHRGVLTGREPLIAAADQFPDSHGTLLGMPVCPILGLSGLYRDEFAKRFRQPYDPKIAGVAFTGSWPARHAVGSQEPGCTKTERDFHKIALLTAR